MVWRACDVALLLSYVLIVVTNTKAYLPIHGEACDPNAHTGFFPLDNLNRNFLFCDLEQGIFLAGECPYPNVFDKVMRRCVKEDDNFIFATEHDDSINDSRSDEDGITEGIEKIGTTKSGISSFSPTNIQLSQSTGAPQLSPLIVYSVEQKQNEKDAVPLRQNYHLDSSNIHKSKQIQEQQQIPKGNNNSSNDLGRLKFLKSVLSPLNVSSSAIINEHGNDRTHLDEEKETTRIFSTKNDDANGISATIKIKKMERIEDSAIPKTNVKVSSNSSKGISNSPDLHVAKISRISMPAGNSRISSDNNNNCNGNAVSVVPTLKILSSAVPTVIDNAKQMDAVEEAKLSVTKCGGTGEFVEAIAAKQQEDWNNLTEQPPAPMMTTTTMLIKKNRGKNHQQHPEAIPIVSNDFSPQKLPGKSTKTAQQCRESLLPPLLENDGQVRRCVPDHGNNPLSQLSCPVSYKCEMSQSAENNEDNSEEEKVYLCCPVVSPVETNIFAIADDPAAPMDVPHFDVVVQPRGMEPITSAKEKEEYDENLDELGGMELDLDHVCPSGFSAKLHPLTGHPTICSPRWPVSSCPPFSRCQYSGQLLQFICCQPVDLLAALREALSIGQRLEAVEKRGSAEKRGFIGRHNNAKAPDNYNNRLGRATQIGILPGQPGCLSHQQCRIRHPGAHCQNWVCKCPPKMVAFDGKCLNHCPSDHFVRDGICTSTTNS